MKESSQKDIEREEVPVHQPLMGSWPSLQPATHHGHVVQHAAVHPALVKLGLVLGQADVVQPP